MPSTSRSDLVVLVAFETASYAVTQSHNMNIPSRYTHIHTAYTYMLHASSDGVKVQNCSLIHDQLQIGGSHSSHDKLDPRLCDIATTVLERSSMTLYVSSPCCCQHASAMTHQ